MSCFRSFMPATEEKYMPTNELLRTNGIGCTVQQGERLERYTELLLEWNTKMNLTGAKTADEVNSHILDCAASHGYLELSRTADTF